MRFAVKVLLWLLVLSAVGILGVAVVLWWPNLIHRFVEFRAAPLTAAQAQQALAENLKNYTERVSDLEKLISVLIGLSAIYTLALGLSSWAAVQTNLQQAKESLSHQTEIMSDVKDRAETAATKLEGLLEDYEQKLKETERAILYAARIPSASASLALALQGQYRSDAELAIAKLLEFRSEYGTDRYVNLYLGRLYKALGKYRSAAGAMTSYIERKQAAQQGDDKDAVDAYYNRACYWSLCWPTAKPAEKTQLQAAIETDVKHFLGINESLKAAIPGDSDFDPVKNENWFKELL